MKRVLIVDDKEENLYYLEVLLGAEGYAVESARHGAEALVLARKAPPDVVISDLLMPVMDGYTLLRHWKGDARLKRVPFIVYTATYTEPEDERLALSLGADAFILKPAEPDDFLRRLREVEAVGIAAVPTMAPEEMSDEAAMLQGYSETLIRKLEQKTMQLEAVNRALQEDVAARQQIELALRASEAQFASAFTHAGVGMALLTPGGQYVKANRALCEMFGYPEAELLTKSYQEVTHPDDRDDHGAVRRMLAGEIDSIRMEKRYLHRGGHVVWGHLTASLLRDEAGAPVHVIAQIQDITERKKSEEATEAAMRRLTDAQRIGQIGDWEWFPKTESIVWSPQVFEILGRDPLLGPPRNYEEYTAIFDEENRAILKASVALAITTGETQGHEVSLQRPDGRRIQIRGVVVPRGAEDGHVVNLHGTIQDITASRQTEAALHRSEALFRTLVQTSWDCFHLVEPTGQIIYESPSVTRLLGYLPEEMVGHNALEFVHPEDVARIMGGVDILAETGSLRTVTLRVRHKDGRWRWVESYEVNLREHPDVRAIAVNYRDITERVEAEAAARRLAAIVESSADAIIGKDTSGIITSWNRGAEKVFGYTERDMVGTSVMRLIPSDRQSEEHYIIGTVLRGESVENFETKRLTKDGRLIDVAVTASPIRDSDGKVIGVSKVARDITARKIAEASANQLLSVLEASLNEIYIFDAETLRFDYVNESARRNLGFSMETMRGQTPLDFKPEFTAESFAALVAPLRSHERPKIIFETVHQRADGSIYPVEVHLQLVEQNEKPVFLAVINDTTEARRVKEALKASEADFRILAESMPQMVWITRADSWNVYHNQQWVDYTGLSVEESAGHGWSVALHPDDQERGARAWAAATATGSHYTVEFRIRRADGIYRWWLVRGVPQRDAAGQIVKWFGTCTDIHDLKQAELEIQTLNSDLERRVALRTSELVTATQEAEEANRAKSDFLSRTSHELRTPLNAILGFGQLLEGEVRDPEQVDSVEQILRAGRHLLELINEMLDISRIEAGHLELALQAVPVSEIFGETLALVRPMARDRGITLDPFESTARVLVDRQRFKQVVLNLLSNAVKYNRPGGRVTCRAAEHGAGRVRVSITDTGIGISTADADKVFTAFGRFGIATTNVEGIGLGLAITRQLTELMGGQIGYESVLGEGSTFWVDLPLATQAVAGRETSAHAAEPAAPPVERAARKLLYIEDNVSNLRLVTRIIARRPAVEFLSAANGTLGLEMAREQLPDMILLDLHLPDIDGDEVLRQLQADPATAGIPVVMLSADAISARREQTLAAGARAFLTKPIEVRAFLAVIDQHLG